MSDGPGLDSPRSIVAPAERRRGVRNDLERLEPTLRIVAEDVLAFSSRIDLIGVDRRQRLTAVAIAEPGAEGALLTTALAHRLWLAQHMGDWLKLAPDLGIDAKAPLRMLLVASSFDVETKAAVAALPAGWIELLRSVAPWRGDGAPRSGLERVACDRGDGHARPPGGAGPPGEGESRFRSGLTREDLALTDEEAASFD